MGKVKQRTNRKDPLLPTAKSGVGALEGSRCGFCGRLLLQLVPIFGCACVIGTLLLLTYGLEVTITDSSISQCLADYEPKEEVLVPISVGATLMCAASAMRNVQINVYHQRHRSDSMCQRLWNFVAAVANFFSYVGFVVLALYNVDGAGDAPLIHDIGAYAYFGLSNVYVVLHSFLLWQQRQYPAFCKILFALVSLGMVACTVVYVIYMEEGYEFEWFAAALAALHVGLISMLFLVDPVDDELGDCFCCRRGGSR